MKIESLDGEREMGETDRERDELKRGIGLSDRGLLFTGNKQSMNLAKLEKNRSMFCAWRGAKKTRGKVAFQT